MLLEKLKHLLGESEQIRKGDFRGILGKSVDLGPKESQVCPRCTSGDICHKSGAGEDEWMEWAHCNNCAADFDIDYEKPF